MRIDFFTTNPDENKGSYRIWIRDISKTLNEMGHTSNIMRPGDKVSNTSEVDAIILGKSCYDEIDQIKKIYDKSKIGAINIPCDYYSKDIDFVIVGSPEEYISMSNYKNVFINPLIERKFENVEPKLHRDKKIMKFCYHGHWPHLAKFEPYISRAIDRYNKEVMTAELHVITGESDDYSGHPSLPKSTKVISYNYRDINLTEVIKNCDIGVVPNITDLTLFIPGIRDTEVKSRGLYKTDFNIRFKNKTNAGRAYVFYQHGIPVIHDLSPSSFDFMGRTGNYVCGHDENSYFREMKRLTNASFRNLISKKNKEVFERDFNTVNYAHRLVEFIEHEVINE